MFKKFLTPETGAGEGTGAGSEGAGGSDGHWSGAIADEGLRTTAASFDDQGAFLKAAGIEAPKAADPVEPTDWRATLTSDDAKEYAERFPDIGKLVDGALEQRKQLSTAIIPPGKDAEPEEVAAYQKRIGVPKTAEDYKFALPKGEELTDSDKAFQASLAKTFHSANITVDQAKLLNTSWNEMVKGTREAQTEADTQFAEEAESDLRKTWPGEEYNLNKVYAERAASFHFGDQIEEVRHLETKAGKFILDHPVMLRAMASIGRQMAESGQPPMDDAAAEQAGDQIKELRGRIAKAQDEGNSKEANRLFALEQELIAKTQGNRAIVGAGRAA